MIEMMQTESFGLGILCKLADVKGITMDFIILVLWTQHSQPLLVLFKEKKNKVMNNNQRTLCKVTETGAQGNMYSSSSSSSSSSKKTHYHENFRNIFIWDFSIYDALKLSIHDAQSYGSS